MKNFVIASIIQTGDDSRHRVNVSVLNKTILSLLDSGANKSCIGGKLAEENLTEPGIRVVSYTGNVSTADGQKQQVVGSVRLNVVYNEQSREVEFLIVPSLKQDLICGIDFWNLFRFKIVSYSVSELCTTNKDHEEIDLNPKDKEKLCNAISAFPSFEKEGLGNTNLVEHVIETGTAIPIKQRCYPISPVREKLLCQEIDRMLELGVIRESENSAWASPAVLLVKPGKVRFCLDSRKLNAVTVKDAYPMPNIEGIVSRLTPVHVISKIDLKDAI